MSDLTSKDLLIEKAVAAGLGEAKTFSNISETNLEKMVKAVEDRDGEIQVLKAAKPKTDVKSNKVTTVADLVRLDKIDTNKAPAEPVEIPNNSAPKEDKE